MPDPTPEDPEAPFEVEPTEYLAHLGVERGLSEHTFAASRRDPRRCAPFLAPRGSTSFGMVTEEDVASYVEAVRTGADGGHPLSPTSTSRAVVAVRGWHRFSRLEGHTDTDPAAAVRPPGTTKRLPKAIAVEEVDKLLAGASMAEGVLGLRDRALVEVLDRKSVVEGRVGA